jgi:LysR family hca operon transcriptional activator
MAHHAVGPSTPTADNLAMAMSLISSTRSVTLLPAYTKNLMPWSLTSRPLDGDAPTIDLVVAYRQENASPRLALCVSQETCLVKPPPVAFDELPK